MAGVVWPKIAIFGHNCKKVGCYPLQYLKIQYICVFENIKV